MIHLKKGPYEATFSPEKGMNMTSFKKGKIEALDLSTSALFEERCAGLGPLIGPHFHHRKEEWITPVADTTLFPHIAAIKAKGQKEFFSHGIARYVPWNVKATDHTITAHLSGDDTYKNIPLKEFEGADFSMTCNVTLTDEGILFDLAVEAERPSIIGLHTYYAIQKGSYVIAETTSEYNDMGVWKSMPADWMQKGRLHYTLDQSADYGFRPKTTDFSGSATLITPTHSIQVSYQAPTDEHAWQLFHPEGASYACVEPLSAKNPRGLIAKKSSLKVRIAISD